MANVLAFEERNAAGVPTGKTYLLPLSNLTAVVGPAVTDDLSLGYVRGSRWLDTVAKKDYVCTDNTVGAAVWSETTSGGGGGPTGAAGGDLGGTYPNPTVTKASGSFAFTGDISPLVGANQNDWNPAGLATASVILATAHIAPISITGLQGGSDGRVIFLFNVGNAAANQITLTNNDAASAAGNRILCPGGSNYVLDKQMHGVVLLYDSTATVWRVIAQVNDGTAGGDLTGTYPSPTVANNKITYAKMQDVSATQRALGRNSAGAGDPEEVTLTQLLDWIGSAAQGDILYRGAASWARLAAGTSGQFLKTLGAAANPAWGDPGKPPDVQVFTANGTWTKPSSSYTVAHRVVIGSGGGGGAGRKRAVGSAGFGGGGGQGGYFSEDTIPLSLLGATESVVVGAGGSGGTAAPLNSTNGSAGGAGNLSSFGAANTASYMVASGGDGGQGGTTAAAAGGNNATANGQAAGGAGGVSGAGATLAGAGAPVTGPWGKASGGGGGGGGLSATNVVATGGAGGPGSAGQQQGGASAAAGLATSAGSYSPGSGGNGSDGNAGAGVNGGHGGFPGGGGGGSGASTNGFLAAFGGDGADGVVAIICW